MGTRAAILTEMKITDNWYPKFVLRYKVIALKATSHKQGVIALVWKEGHCSFEMEVVTIATPNLLTFQLITAYKRFYVMGIYTPPNDTMGVDMLQVVWHACPDNCVLIIMGDLNIRFEHPCDKWEEAIAIFLDEINLIESTCNFCLWQCWMHMARRRWTWCQKWMGQWRHSQPG
jgi:hypothetical protein